MALESLGRSKGSLTPLIGGVKKETVKYVFIRPFLGAPYSSITPFITIIGSGAHLVGGGFTKYVF